MRGGGNWKRDYGDSYTGTQGETLDTAKERPTDYRASSRPYHLVQHAVRANIRASANQLRHGSEVLEELIQKARVLVVGAEYSLETGCVDFFDGVPEAG